MGQLVRKGEDVFLGIPELGSVGMVAVRLVAELHWATGQQLFSSGW